MNDYMELINGYLDGELTDEQFAELVAGIAEGAPNGIRVTPKEITAEDDRVAMEAESYGEMSNGKVYNNRYHLQHVVRDGKLLAVREYLDTQHVQDVFGSAA